MTTQDPSATLNGFEKDYSVINVLVGKTKEVRNGETRGGQAYGHLPELVDWAI